MGKARVDAYQADAARSESVRALFAAAGNGRFAEVTRLVQAGADVNAVHGGGTILCSALWHKNVDCAYFLLAHGARTDLDHGHRVGNLLWSACSISVKDPEQKKKLLSIVERLLLDGQDVNCRDTSVGYTPLLAAADVNNVAVAKELLAHGAKVNVVDFDGNTPLIAATRNGSVDMVTLLLEHGADMRASNESGQAPLAIAQAKGSGDIVRILRHPSLLALENRHAKR